MWRPRPPSGGERRMSQVCTTTHPQCQSMLDISALLSAVRAGAFGFAGSTTLWLVVAAAWLAYELYRRTFIESYADDAATIAYIPFWHWVCRDRLKGAPGSVGLTRIYCISPPWAPRSSKPDPRSVSRKTSTTNTSCSKSTGKLSASSMRSIRTSES